MSPAPTRVFVAVGAAAGLFSGLLGVGGGFLLVPGQVIWARTRQLQANATSLVAIIPISAVGVIVYYFVGSGGHHEADFRFAAVMTVGAVVGAYAGAKLVSRVPDTALRTAVALILLLAALKQMIVPGG